MPLPEFKQYNTLFWELVVSLSAPINKKNFHTKKQAKLGVKMFVNLWHSLVFIFIVKSTKMVAQDKLRFNELLLCSARSIFEQFCIKLMRADRGPFLAVFPGKCLVTFRALKIMDSAYTFLALARIATSTD